MFFSGPSVESSRVSTALSLRLQVDFSPLLVFPLFRKQHAVKVQSGLTASNGLHFRLRGKDEVDDQWPPMHALT